ncbi:MAG: lysophospholipid acyltransferase family protein [Planctomycetota bacterium]|jgi:lysophospholipid acyltransferase (LPLAT)-like uncharacterized protein
MGLLRFLIAWIVGFAVVCTRWSCRVHWHDDIRPALREAGTPYIYAILHCHQVGAVIGREPGTGAMVSRSRDGYLIVPSLKMNGVIPYRGSSRKAGEGDKGGSAALKGLVDHLRSGRPAYLAVDGPRGPRNQVQFGIAKLAMTSGATVLTAMARPTRRWILSGTWDRFQIPKPFSKIDAFFGDPLRPHEGEDIADFRQRIEDSLTALEERHDPEEAALGKVAADKRRTKNALATRRGASGTGLPRPAVHPDGAREPAEPHSSPKGSQH